MLKIYRNGITRSIATKIPPPPRLVDSCILIRSASTQISSQKWPWVRKQQQQQPLLSLSVKPSLSQSHSRCYSIDSSDDPPGPGQQIPNTDRKIPKMSNETLHFGAPPFAFLILNFKAFKIRKYDADFALSEFVEGSKKAVEVVSDKLSAGDFDGLRGMVTDDLIDELREKLADWTDDQRAQLRSKSEDMCRSILRSIETVERDDGSLIAKLSMVYHVVEGFQDLTEGKFDNEFQKKVSAKDFLRKSSEFLDENFQILNYTFLKEFSEDSNDDWIISFINHANIRDEMMEHTKIIEETMRQMREKSQKK